VSGAVRYKCLNCGECCNRLLIDRQGVRKGLTLLPGETELFREDRIRPGYGIGADPGNASFETIAYQMRENACPHRQRGGCRVWSYRPAICRAYPFMPVITQGRTVLRVYDLACTSLKEYIGRYPNDILNFDPDSVQDEVAYCDEISRITQRLLDNPGRAWFYDLKTEEWVRFESMLGP
jgi:Fe-S-cluster containining protein